MHVGAVSEGAGEFTAEEKASYPCPRCGAEVRELKWESKCGAFEDYKYVCSNARCTYTRWVDGPDS